MPNPEFLLEIDPEYIAVNCPLCTTAASELVHRRENYLMQTSTHRFRLDIAYRVCTCCGLVFMSPQMSPGCWNTFLSGSSFSPLPIKVDPRHVAAKTPSFIIDACDATLNSRSSVLEIGCGDGHFLYYLQQTIGCKVLGLDLSQRHVEYALNLGVPAKQMDFLDCPDPSNPYDLIICRHVIEHLANPLDGLAKIRGLLNDNGRVILEVPSVFHPCYSIRDIFSAHNFMFSPTTMKNLIQRAGFSIDACNEDSVLMYILHKADSTSATLHNDYAKVKRVLDENFARYRRVCDQVSVRLNNYIKKWKAANTRVAIWGAGEHTATILNDYDLAGCDILCIVDSNRYLWGSTLGGLQVVSPRILQEEEVDEVLISSWGYESEIAEEIQQIDAALVVRRLYR